MLPQDYKEEIATYGHRVTDMLEVEIVINYFPGTKLRYMISSPIHCRRYFFSL